MPRFHRRPAAAVLSLALALPFLGWIGGLGDLWQQVVVAVTAASASGDPATAPEPESPRAPESLDSSSAGPEEEDDTGKLDPNG